MSANDKSTARSFMSSVSPKGQITLPAVIRTRLGIKPKDCVLIELDEDGILRVRPASGLERYYGAAGRLKQPMAWKQLERIAHEDHVLNAAREGLE
jgi:AbrB family looped-hinge helix DNA binding protein